MAVSSPRRLDFEPDGIPSVTAHGGDQSPALSSSSALARFEFAHGRGNEGTKILMVEWEDDETDASKNTAGWEVSWEGKSTILSARDGADGRLHRVYFLIPPGTSIPRIVKVAQTGGKLLQTNPLPAIFPPELGASATASGKLGVLHTVYAKQRLSVLQKEIEHEMKTNGEGIGLEMAMQEKQWIEDNFGVGPRVMRDEDYASSPISASPKTPGGSRIAEKLKGLKLGTSDSQLRGIKSDHGTRAESNPLSPDMGDVAVSSFSLFHGGLTRPQTRAVGHNPPEQLIAIQNESRGPSGMSSLDAVAGGVAPARDDNETEEGLFAVKLSPRSPEMTKSPFSFAAKDTAPWLKNNE
ncbi:hypothetical protein D0Z07_3581 [Hyphodiscus hymeniophilus]|uniref:Uncharacterized protein n=1 Tax=Hyphodiscus hymeniophilus TaxID=353542 RepID=A0A9P6VL13_9HELO|nr:hypothetical protein D0Z07_3581 [Hyphodiscus hymeniophilus]